MEDQETLARDLKVNLVHNPSKYLGLNFKLKGNRIADFHFLVEKLQTKLQGWKARLLSQAGEQLLFLQCYNPFRYILFPALKSLIKCVMRWMPLLEPFDGGTGKERKNFIF